MARIYHRGPAEERFWLRVDAFGDCWDYTGSDNGKGYGVFRPAAGQHVYAHRYAWELLVGPIPEGMEIDHLCRNRRCVNPDHLRVTTPRENNLSSQSNAARNARKTQCKHGHPLTPENLLTVKANGHRRCRQCNQDRHAREAANISPEARQRRAERDHTYYLARRDRLPVAPWTEEERAAAAERIPF